MAQEALALEDRAQAAQVPEDLAKAARVQVVPGPEAQGQLQQLAARARAARVQAKAKGLPAQGALVAQAAPALVQHLERLPAQAQQLAVQVAETVVQA